MNCVLGVKRRGDGWVVARVCGESILQGWAQRERSAARGYIQTRRPALVEEAVLGGGGITPRGVLYNACMPSGHSIHNSRADRAFMHVPIVVLACMGKVTGSTGGCHSRALNWEPSAHIRCPCVWIGGACTSSRAQ